MRRLRRVLGRTYERARERPQKRRLPPLFKTAEDRLFFILFYFKTYPLQEVLAYSFEMSQSEANKLIHLLSLVLKMALQKTGSIPQDCRMTC
ncbi:helix-turn-helix domain-containing protein [Methylomagnum sp.]